VEKNQYDLCIEILRRLKGAGVLNNLIIIGSWCSLFYKQYFAKIKYSPSIKTRDIDFLIPSPKKFQSNIDIPNLLRDLGFIIGFKSKAGYITLEHPSLIIEFLVPEKGKGLDQPYPLPQLGLNAQALRFLNFLTQSKITILVQDIPVTLPHPAYFALQKLIISKRRKNPEKTEKDINTATNILKALVDKNESSTIKRAFESAPKQWQKKIIKELEKTKEKVILDLLK